MKKKILYLSHVPWEWIKQRPHFIAEGLSDKFEIDFVHLMAYNKKNLSINILKNENLKTKSLFRLPNKFSSISFFKKLNEIILSLQIRILLKNKYDFIWITSPIFFPYIKNNQNIVYDCMDDNIGIKNSQQRKYIIQLEQQLLKRAEIVFVSSKKLKEVVKNRGYTKEAILVNNALSKDFLQQIYKNTQRKKYNNKLLYVGTISYWFDFELILQLLEEIKDISLDLIGPKEVDIPKHDRLNYLGIVPHNKLATFIDQYEVLLMPFKVNELILSVDPVKIYEYIVMKKIIISVDYPELNKFKDFIYTYKNFDDFKDIIIRWKSGKLAKNINEEKLKEFISNNTWENRVKIIIDTLSQN